MRVRRPWVSAWFVVAAALYCGAFQAAVVAQNAVGNPSAPAGVANIRLETGEDVYRAACVSCHGADGRGAPRNSVAFDTRLPDFTDCSFATKEPDGDWSATIHNGGPARGFSPIMPAFRDALTGDQIDNVIAYMRGFCRSKAWPSGDLNFPRALITEKAFPESEVVVTSAFNANRTSGNGTTLIIEKRVEAGGQIEVALPYWYTKESPGPWMHGFGDAAIGYKQMLFHNNERGSIFSVAGEVIAPTGDPAKGTGGETGVFETFAAFDQALPHDTFVQFPHRLRAALPHEHRAQRMVCPYGHRPELQHRRRARPDVDADGGVHRGSRS